MKTRCCAAASPVALGSGEPPRSELLGELQLQRPRVERMPYLCVVERREPEGVLCVELVELDIELAARDELARQHCGPDAVLPGNCRVDVAAIAGEPRYHDSRHLVPGLELAVVERHLVFGTQVVRAPLDRSLAVLAHELGLA